MQNNHHSIVFSYNMNIAIHGMDDETAQRVVSTIKSLADLQKKGDEK